MIASCLILPSEPEGEALLATLDGSALVTERGDSDSLLARAARPLALVLPGQSVRSFQTDLPAAIKSKDRADVARFAHEDQLAVSPVDLHIVVGPGEQAATHAINPDIMAQMIEAADPHVIVADFAALGDLAPDDVFLLDRVVRPGAIGMSVDPDWIEGEILRLDDARLVQAMMDRIGRGDIINLRRGPYRRRAKVQAGPWMRVAAMVVACCVLGLGLTLADARAKSIQAESLSAEARTLYTDMTGQTPPQPLSRLARMVDASGGGSDAFLSLSEQLFQTLSSYPDVKVQRLSFDVEENALRLSLIYPNFEAATALEQAFTQSGARFVTGGVREQNGDFIGDANLSAGDGGRS